MFWTKSGGLKIKHALASIINAKIGQYGVSMSRGVFEIQSAQDLTCHGSNGCPNQSRCGIPVVSAGSLTKPE